jgi:hypothetical protein
MHAGKEKDTICSCAHLTFTIDPPGGIAICSFSCYLPVLLDVERPLELQVHVLVVVGEHGGSLVVATAEHAGRCGLGLDWVGKLGLLAHALQKMPILTLLLVFRLVGGVGRVGALSGH